MARVRERGARLVQQRVVGEDGQPVEHRRVGVADEVLVPPVVADTAQVAAELPRRDGVRLLREGRDVSLDRRIEVETAVLDQARHRRRRHRLRDAADAELHRPRHRHAMLEVGVAEAVRPHRRTVDRHRDRDARVAALGDVRAHQRTHLVDHLGVVQRGRRHRGRLGRGQRRAQAGEHHGEGDVATLLHWGGNRDHRAGWASHRHLLVSGAALAASPPIAAFDFRVPPPPAPVAIPPPRAPRPARARGFVKFGVEPSPPSTAIPPPPAPRPGRRPGCPPSSSCPRGRRTRRGARRSDSARPAPSTGAPTSPGPRW